MTEIRFAATGDSFITRRLPASDTRPASIAPIINAADVRFTNLEVVVRRDEGFPSAESGGTWASAPPEVLDDLASYGFNVLATANNHTLDYTYGGLEATQRYLDAHDFVHMGTGKNLAQASAVRYLECMAGRVGCIAATSTCPAWWAAGEQRGDMHGRPGVNHLRHQTVHQVHRQQMEKLKRIAADCGINTARELAIKEGFQTPDAPGMFRFGEHQFEVVDDDQPQRQTTRVNDADRKRMLKAIDEANHQADLIIVSIHAHEMQDGQKDRPADYLVDFARACIDAGAHAVIGHGPHILRGIEIYRDRPIFYSLGNFIFQNDTVTHLPADFYRKYSLGPEHNVVDALNTRSDHDAKGLGANPKVWQSVIATWTMNDGALTELTLHPICLGYGEPRYRRGWPRLTDDTAALEQAAELSKAFGTAFDLTDGRACWSGGMAQSPRAV